MQIIQILNIYYYLLVYKTYFCFECKLVMLVMMVYKYEINQAKRNKRHYIFPIYIKIVIYLFGNYLFS